MTDRSSLHGFASRAEQRAYYAAHRLEALLAALDALVVTLRRRADNAESCNFSISAHGIRMCVEELEPVIAAHREST